MTQKTFDELMADARDCEAIRKKLGYKTTEDFIDPYLPTAIVKRKETDAFEAGHRAAMDRMEPALRCAMRALEQVRIYADNEEVESECITAMNKIREILAKGAG